MVKIASYLLNLSFNDLENNTTDSFLAESLSIIKAGGKIDESIYYFSKNLWGDNS